MSIKNTSESSVAIQTPLDIYPDHIPLPPGDGRCMYRFPSGPRCRKSASQIHPYFCEVHLHHAAARQNSSTAGSSGGRSFSSDMQHSSLPISNAGHGNRQNDDSFPPPPAYDPTLAAELLAAARKLTTARDVNRVLLTVYRAMIEHRLAPKEAGLLCYLAQTILHTHRAVAFHQKLKAQAATAAAEDERRNEPAGITWNLP